MIKQRSLKTITRVTGIALHSGDCVELVIRPAQANTGIIFRRTDLSPVVDIPATADRVSDTMLCTCLSQGFAKVSTIEHLMSAFAGLGIDNAYVDVSASEIPIMDGSSAPFVFLIKSAGIEELSTPKRFIRIKRKVKVMDGDKWATFEPYEGFKIDFTIDFNHPAFKAELCHAQIDFSIQSYESQISRARTFGFMKDFEQLQKMNLAKGASLDNAVALDQFKVLNPEGLRYEDECLRHKILDAIGDLYLMGAPILGFFKAFKSGHALNNKLLRQLQAEPDAWEYVTMESAHVRPSLGFKPLALEA